MANIVLWALVLIDTFVAGMVGGAALRIMIVERRKK